ncbi:MAG: response regulator [Spirochaetales bacterium]|nr:response regulator [Spirochaetales bacterium]
MAKIFNILVVDDDLKNIQVGINFLKKNKNYHLLFATSGQQALERVKETKFDLILLDIMMPVMDGYEVCKILKEDVLTKNIPVLFLTAKHGTENIIEGFEAGGADYITKPFNSHELTARVKTHIELHYHHQKEIEKLQDILFHSQRAETISFLSNGITHDCNNFMCSISPNLHLINSKIKEQGLDPEEYTDYFQGINSAVTRTSELLRQLSTYAEYNESKPEIVDMNNVITDVTKILKGSLRELIELEIIFLNQPAHAFANKIHIEQVLINIIINAEHAIVSQTKTDGRKGNINVTISKTNGKENQELQGETDYLRIDIKDNGTGMNSETMKNIFNPYFTTRKKEGGTGLGLAVSQSIVKSHNGIIKVESEIGKGSCFCIYFPFYESE